MKVVELLKPYGAQSFLEYRTAYIPHLGGQTCCFLDMFITHVLLKMCKNHTSDFYPLQSSPVVLTSLCFWYAVKQVTLSSTAEI